MARALLLASLAVLACAALLPSAAEAQKVAPGKKVVAKAKAKGTVMNPLAKKKFFRADFGYTASYYGGQTDGGSCGYGSAQQSPFGVYTCSASPVLYANGANCGACFRMSCLGGGRCIPGLTPVLTLSNMCKAGDSGNLCTGKKKSYSLAPTTWNTIAVNPNLGVVPVRVTRVPCARVGGVTFKVLVGNPFYIQVLISNAAGSGDIAAAMVKVTSPSAPAYWQPMKRSFGSVWAFSGTGMGSASFSFKLTTGFWRETIIVPDGVPMFYEVGTEYPSAVNFKLK